MAKFPQSYVKKAQVKNLDVTVEAFPGHDEETFAELVADVKGGEQHLFMSTKTGEDESDVQGIMLTALVKGRRAVVTRLDLTDVKDSRRMSVLLNEVQSYFRVAHEVKDVFFPTDVLVDHKGKNARAYNNLMVAVCANEVKGGYIRKS
ncbi:hypothetical protein GR11A_00222 [Vibrio phage vB_VcorM_GR11A]|nr:hypothetical protein GR11A_00222 [Vibrio phage vB_VcorM_GR11A]